jgi:hypothetical protein
MTFIQEQPPARGSKHVAQATILPVAPAVTSLATGSFSQVSARTTQTQTFSTGRKR